MTQQAFCFVSPEERQAMADKYEGWLKRALKRTGKLPRQNPDDVRVELAPASLPLFAGPRQAENEATQVVRIEVLQQPLFAFADDRVQVPELDAIDEAVAPTEDDEFSCSEEEKQEHVAWLADRPEQFVGYVLDQAFDVLAGIGNAREKAHIIEWMFAADIHGYLHYVEEVPSDDDGAPGGKVERVQLTRPIFSVDVPMTFQWCCKVFGLRADAVQARVLDALKDAIAHTRERERNGELKPGRHNVYVAAHQLASIL